MLEESVIRILIADDHPIVREGLTAILAHCSDMQVIAQARSGKEAIELFRQHRPDVALMDVRMPKMDGPEAIGIIRTEFPRARILILTTYDADDYIFRALRAGAKGFLLKDASREQLLEAIRTVHAGRTYFPSEVTSKLAVRMGRPELTARERGVLQLMSRGKSNQDIASELFIAETTVKSHVNSILSKMQVRDRTQAVTLALQQGMVSLE
jgi:two-component system, NarL family, response regulator